MIPILFEHNATTFTGHGLGDLVDTISCVVKQSDTHEFELEMRYPWDGAMASMLTTNRLIYAKVNNLTHHLSPKSAPYQAFRIYSCDKESAGYLDIKAQHISYDLANIFIMPYDTSSYGPNCYGKHYDYVTGWVSSPYDLLNYINNNNFVISGTNLFTITQGYYPMSPIGSDFQIMAPRSVRSLLFDSKDSLIANFGGMCGFDNYSLSFYGLRDPYTPSIKATIEYGVNLIDFKQETNNAEMITGILPYYSGKDPRYEEYNSVVYGQVINASGTFDRQVILPVDLSQPINDAGISGGGFGTIYDSVSGRYIDVPEVDTFGQQWAQINKLGVPKINITLDYYHIPDETISLYDRIRVYFKKMDISTDSIVTSTTYDVLNERNVEIELGHSKASKRYYDEYDSYRGKAPLHG